MSSSIRITFPQDFLWGVSMSSYQIEGAWNEDGKGESIWDRFTHIRGNIKNGDSGDVACDHYHRYKEDVDLMKELGIHAYFFSISWPRVLPKGEGDVNEAGLDFYKRLVDKLSEAGIEPCVFLYHWELPQTLQDKGGWVNRDIVQLFADYAKLIGRELGDKVKWWVMIDEPQVVASEGYLTGEHAPGIKDFGSFLKASHHVQLAQGKAIQTLRDIKSNFQMGVAFNLTPFYPIKDDEKDREAARKLDEFLNRWYLDPLLKGEYPRLAREIGMKPDQDDMNMIHQPIDFLGVNYYTRGIAAYDPTKPLKARVISKNTPTTEMGWEIYPDGLYDLLTRLKRDYNDPVFYVTENGAAFDDKVEKNGRIEDDDRIRFLRDHMIAAKRTIRDGIKLKGYFIWSLLDNFEWAKGYAKRFGLVHVNYRTLKRTPKKSFYWYKQVITNNGFTFLLNVMN